MDRSENNTENVVPMDISRSTQSTNRSPLSTESGSGTIISDCSSGEDENVFSRNINNATKTLDNETFRKLYPKIYSDKNLSFSSINTCVTNTQVQSVNYMQLNRYDLLKSRELSENNQSDLADISSILSNTVSKNLIKMNNSEIIRDTTPTSIVNEPVHNPQDEEFRKKFRKMKLLGKFPCDICGNIFPNLRALKGHNKQHLDDPNHRGPYKCNMCSYTSNDKLSIIRHMRTHNGDKPFECLGCHYAFTTKANCERHIRNRHHKTEKTDIKNLIQYHQSQDPTPEQLSQILAEDGSIHELRTRPSNARLNMTNNNNNNNEVQLPVFSINSLPMPARMQLSSPESSSSDIIPDVQEEALDLSMKKNHEIIPVINSSNGTHQLPTLNGINELTSENLRWIIHYLLSKGVPYSDMSRIIIQFCHNYCNSTGQNEPNNEENLQDDQSESDSNLAPSGLDIVSLKEKLKYTSPSLNRKGSIPHNLLPESLQPLTKRTWESNNNVTLRNVGLDSAKEVIGEQVTPNPTNQVVSNDNDSPVVKQKQRRYRTERPHVCYVCSSGFTLRSNMDRHIKQQHRSHWLKRERERNAPSTSSNQLQAIVNVQKNGGDASTSTMVNNSAMSCDDHYQHEPIIEIKQEEDGDVQMQVNGMDIAESDEVNDNLVIDETSEGKLPATNDTSENKMNTSESDFDRMAVKIELDDESYTKSICSPPVPIINHDQIQVSIDDDTDTDHISTGSGTDADYESLDEEGLIANCSYSDSNTSGTDENKSEKKHMIINDETKMTLELDSNANHQLRNINKKQKTSAYAMAPNRVQCNYCNRTFPWESSLRRHILTHTGQKPHKCPQCNLLFTTKSNRDRHVSRKHLKKYSIPISRRSNNSASCSSNSSNESGIIATNNNFIPSELSEQSLLLRNVPERPYKCSECPSSTFASLVNLQKHMMLKHRPDSNHMLNSEDDLHREHSVSVSANFNTVTVDLPFKCHLCEKSYSRSSDNLEHIAEKHPIEYELLKSKWGPDFRSLAATTFQQKDTDYDDHKDKFPDYANRKVICSLCYKRFWSAEDLRRHMRTHTGDKPYSCDICLQRFSLKHSMLRHRKKHFSDITPQENNFFQIQQAQHFPYPFPFIRRNNYNSCDLVDEK